MSRSSLGYSRSYAKRNRMAAARSTTQPSISGTFAPGQVLTANIGNWSGSATISYQWTLDKSRISGAKSQTYTVAAKDAGRSLSCIVKASDARYGELSLVLAAKR